MPHELWAAKPQDMSQAMQVFLDEQGPFMKSLTANERSDLSTLEGLWPEYPLRVQELAGQNGFRQPWQSLPEFPNKGNVWDKYRAQISKQIGGVMPFRGLANRRQRYRPADLPLALLPFDPAIQRVALHRHAARLLDQPPQSPPRVSSCGESEPAS